MHISEGRLTELRLDERQGALLAWIACPPAMVPTPGRYLLAWAAREGDAPLATPLFATQVANDGFLAAAPIPTRWAPGERLHLRGPLGRGFELPSSARRLALAGLGDGAARLLPLVPLALAQDAAVALFIDGPPPKLAEVVEVNPLAALPESLACMGAMGLLPSRAATGTVAGDPRGRGGRGGPVYAAARDRASTPPRLRACAAALTSTSAAGTAGP